jgi:hypothetical protein
MKNLITERTGDYARQRAEPLRSGRQRPVERRFVLSVWVWLMTAYL